MHRRHFVLVLSAASLVTAGCGPRNELGDVRGTVRIDGQPLANVLVTFVPEEKVEGRVLRSMGQTNERGEFTPRAENQSDGAVVGKHRVIVEDLAIHSAPRVPPGAVWEPGPMTKNTPSFVDEVPRIEIDDPKQILVVEFQQ